MPATRWSVSTFSTERRPGTGTGHAARFVASPGISTPPTDAQYTLLLRAALYTADATDFLISHRSGSLFRVPGLPDSTTAFTPSSVQTSLERTGDRSGSPVTGGFGTSLFLARSFGTGARRATAAAVNWLIRSHASQIDSALVAPALDVASDAHVYHALHAFLVGDHGRLVAWPSGGLYEETTPPRINVGTGGGATDTRATLVHELLHYVFDRADSILRARNSGGADHHVISAIEAKFVLVHLLRSGQAPFHTKLQNAFGIFVGHDFYADIQAAVRANDAQALQRAVADPLFERLTVASGVLPSASSVAAIGRGMFDDRFLDTPDLLRDLAYIYSQLAAIMQRAMTDAIAIAASQGLSLAAVFSSAAYRQAISAFVDDFVGTLQSQPARSATALAATVP